MACRSGSGRCRAAARLAVSLLALAAQSVSGEGLSVARLADEIAAVGARVPGTAGHRQAQRILLAAMDRAGLEEIVARPSAGRGHLRILEGVLGGRTDSEILLTAHYDTVEGSAGAADNAAGCAVVLAAAATLAEIPRQHGVRVVLFDGEENGQTGSSTWVESLTPQRRASALAAVNVDLVGLDSGSRGVVLTPLVDVGSRWRVAPAWLVAAAVEAGRSIGDPMAVGAEALPLLAQGLMRTVTLSQSSDGERLLAGGLPAVTLSEASVFRADPENHGPGDRPERLDEASLERWVVRLGAMVQRLDRLAGRPRDDDQYVAALGRVWSRRDLYWVGLVVWIAMVVQGIRQARSRVSRLGRRNRLALFALRFLFLATVLMLPVFSLLLLVPAAVVYLVPVESSFAQRSKQLVACAPVSVLLLGIAWLSGHGRAQSFVLGLPAVLLLSGTLGTLLWAISSQPSGGAQRGLASAAKVDTASSHSSTEL